MSSDDDHWRAHLTPMARCTCTVFFNSRAELFDCGVANDMLKFTHVRVHGVDTMTCFCFAIKVCFSLKKLISSALPETCVAFLQENYCTHLLRYFFFLEIDVCVYLSFC